MKVVAQSIWRRLNFGTRNSALIAGLALLTVALIMLNSFNEARVAEFNALKQRVDQISIAQRSLEASIFSGESRHVSARRFALQSQLDASSGKFLVMAGDSIVEGAAIAALCGWTVFNAGIGGSSVDVLRSAVLPLFSFRTLPVALLIATGVNETRHSDGDVRLQLDDFRERYGLLLDAAKEVAPKVAALAILPVEAAKPLGESYFDISRIRRFNEVISQESRKRGLFFVDVFSAFEGPNGYARAGVTTDGVHLTSASYALWKVKIEDGLCHVIDR